MGVIPGVGAVRVLEVFLNVRGGNLTQTLNRVNRQVGMTQTAFVGATKSVRGFQTQAVMSLLGVSTVVGATTRHFAEFQRQAQLAAFAGGKSLSDMTKMSNQLSRNFASSSIEMAKLAKEVQQLGDLSERSALAIAEMGVQFELATGRQTKASDAAATVFRLITIESKRTGISIEELAKSSERFGSAIVAAGDLSAAGISQLEDFLERLQSIGIAANFSTNEIVALGGALSNLEPTQGRTFASAITRLFSKSFVNPSSASNIRKFIEETGVLRDVVGKEFSASEFRQMRTHDPDRLLVGLVQALTALGAEGGAAKAVELGITNVRDIRLINALAAGVELYAKQLEAVNGQMFGTGETLLSERTRILMLQLQGAFDGFTASLGRLADTVGDVLSPVLVPLLKTMEGLVNVVAENKLLAGALTFGALGFGIGGILRARSGIQALGGGKFFGLGNAFGFGGGGGGGGGGPPNPFDALFGGLGGAAAGGTMSGVSRAGSRSMFQNGPLLLGPGNIPNTLLLGAGPPRKRGRLIHMATSAGSGPAIPILPPGMGRNDFITSMLPAMPLMLPSGQRPKFTTGKALSGSRVSPKDGKAKFLVPKMVRNKGVLVHDPITGKWHRPMWIPAADGSMKNMSLSEWERKARAPVIKMNDEAVKAAKGMALSSDELLMLAAAGQFLPEGTKVGDIAGKGGKILPSGLKVGKGKVSAGTAALFAGSTARKAVRGFQSQEAADRAVRELFFGDGLDRPKTRRFAGRMPFPKNTGTLADLGLMALLLPQVGAGLGRGRITPSLSGTGTMADLFAPRTGGKAASIDAATRALLTMDPLSAALLLQGVQGNQPRRKGGAVSRFVQMFTMRGGKRTQVGGPTLRSAIRLGSGLPSSLMLHTPPFTMGPGFDRTAGRFRMGPDIPGTGPMGRRSGRAMRMFSGVGPFMGGFGVPPMPINLGQARPIKRSMTEKMLDAMMFASFMPFGGRGGRMDAGRRGMGLSRRAAGAMRSRMGMAQVGSLFAGPGRMANTALGARMSGAFMSQLPFLAMDLALFPGAGRLMSKRFGGKSTRMVGAGVRGTGRGIRGAAGVIRHPFRSIGAGARGIGRAAGARGFLDPAIRRFGGLEGRQLRGVVAQGGGRRAVGVNRVMGRGASIFGGIAGRIPGGGMLTKAVGGALGRGGAAGLAARGGMAALGVAGGPVGLIVTALSTLVPLFRTLGNTLQDLGQKGGIIGFIAKRLASLFKILELLGNVVNFVFKAIFGVIKKVFDFILNLPGIKQVVQLGNKGFDKLNKGLDSANAALTGEPVRGAPPPVPQNTAFNVSFSDPEQFRRIVDESRQTATGTGNFATTTTPTSVS